MERMPCSDRDSRFWQDLYICPRQCSCVLRDCIHLLQVDCILLRKRQYILCHIHQCFSRMNSFLENKDSPDIYIRGENIENIWSTIKFFNIESAEGPTWNLFQRFRYIFLR